LHWMSPERFVQISIIAQLAKDLPADAVLAVKETVYGIGKRPVGFYDQIKALRNTELVDPSIPGIDMVNASSIIATVSGSAGIEGAVAGKPVLLFGRHNYYDFIPHAFKIFGVEDLVPAFDAIFGGSYDHTEAAENGARLRQAIIDASFDLGGYNNLDLTSYRDKDVQAAIVALETDLETYGAGVKENGNAENIEAN
jgi:hypothetical protein